MADAFAGLGGIRLAFQAIGLACAWACEIDRFAARVYGTNFGDDPTGDITAVNACDMPDFDILCAGFPCQSHSLQGKRRGMNDPRGRLIYHLLRILRAKRPKGFLFENVENFQHIDGGRPFANLKAHLERLRDGAHVLGNELDLTDEQFEQQLAAYTQHLRRFHSLPQEPPSGLASQ